MRIDAPTSSSGLLRLRGGLPLPPPSYLHRGSRVAHDFGFGTAQLPSFGSGLSLYLPMVGLAALVVGGQVRARAVPIQPLCREELSPPTVHVEATRLVLLPA